MSIDTDVTTRLTALVDFDLRRAQRDAEYADASKRGSPTTPKRQSERGLQQISLQEQAHLDPFYASAAEFVRSTHGGRCDLQSLIAEVVSRVTQQRGKDPFAADLFQTAERGYRPGAGYFARKGRSQMFTVGRVGGTVSTSAGGRSWGRDEVDLYAFGSLNPSTDIFEPGGRKVEWKDRFGNRFHEKVKRWDSSNPQWASSEYYPGKLRGLPQGDEAEKRQILGLIEMIASQKS